MRSSSSRGIGGRGDRAPAASMRGSCSAARRAAVAPVPTPSTPMASGSTKDRRRNISTAARTSWASFNPKVDPVLRAWGMARRLIARSTYPASWSGSDQGQHLLPRCAKIVYQDDRGLFAVQTFLFPQALCGHPPGAPASLPVSFHPEKAVRLGRNRPPGSPGSITPGASLGCVAVTTSTQTSHRQQRRNKHEAIEKLRMKRENGVPTSSWILLLRRRRSEKRAFRSR